MRVRVTLDDDVATQIEQLQKERDAMFAEIVDEALRLGLREMTGELDAGERDLNKHDD